KETVDVRRRREADWIARRLRALLDSQEPLIRDESQGESKLRRVRPGDIAILFRALTDLAYYEPALRRCGIEYYLVGGQAFYAQQEVYDVLNLLRALAIRSDEISLSGVLRSPFFNLPDETLYWLAERGGGLSAAMESSESPSELSDRQTRAVDFARNTLQELRASKDHLPIAELLRLALERTGYDAVLVSEFLGERKLANLRKLIDLARSFDRAGFLTLNDYITQLSQFVAKQPKEPPAATQAETAQVVRIMSIHQSKGLEFPVVVVPDLGRASDAGSSSVAFHSRLGPLVRPPRVGRDETGVTGKRLHEAIESDADEEERVRLLYVATTRAADMLILSSGVTDLDKPSSQWMRLLARRFDLHAGNPLDSESDRLLEEQLGSDHYQPPQVRVISESPPTPKPKQQSKQPELSQLADQALKARKAEVPPLVGAIPPDVGGRRQYSVSRLHGLLEEPTLAEKLLRRQAASLLDGEELEQAQALQLGSLVHAVLEEAAFDDPLINVSRLVKRHFDRLDVPGGPPVDGEEAQRLVRKFLDSPRAMELRGATQTLREAEFLLSWPPGAPRSSDGLYFRGCLDCLYQDAEGTWRLLDYKTDRVEPGAMDAVAEQYQMQLHLYGLAAERTLKEPFEEAVLHFLRTGDEYVIPWNDQARRRAADLVNEALDRARRPLASDAP
ncbi:MAG: PD-(D/E)XK nuclease family protein, partial [Planctomycetales bacterium]